MTAFTRRRLAPSSSLLGCWEEQDAPWLSCNPAASFKPRFFIYFYGVFLACGVSALLLSFAACTESALAARLGTAPLWDGEHRFGPVAAGVGARCWRCSAFVLSSSLLVGQSQRGARRDFSPCQTPGKTPCVPCPGRQLPGWCRSQLTVPFLSPGCAGSPRCLLWSWLLGKHLTLPSSGGLVRVFAIPTPADPPGSAPEELSP